MNSGRGITCFKCRSIENNNGVCNDPFRYQSGNPGGGGPRVERRECPSYERCVKITGYNNHRQYFLIRDCYKTNYHPSGSYRDRRISYYQDIVDGEISVCNYNFCNRSTPTTRITLIIMISLLTMLHVIQTIILP